MNTKLLIYFLRIIIGITLSSSALADFDQTFDYGKLSQGLDDLDRSTAQKWDQLQEWQQKSSWVNEQVRLGVVGTVYDKGMFGVNVSRNIVPDKTEGWLTVDTIRVPTGPLLQLGSLAGNIFFQEVFPYLQVGAVYERGFFNVRHADTYKDALLADPFRCKKIPVSLEGFDSFAKGEQVSTTTTGGVYVRAGASIFSLLGINLAKGVTVGPTAKIQVNRQFKITMANNSDSDILVMIEKTIEKDAGIGFAAGISVSDAISAPISIGINQGNGYSPIRINYKAGHNDIDGIIYRISKHSAEGKRAYEALMNRDLTVLDNLADGKSDAVVRELVRNGKVNTREFNVGVDLILFRSGQRNIFVDAKYNSTIAGGKKFSYREISAEKIAEGANWISGKQKSEKYSVLVPLQSNDSFILDSSFVYVNSRTNGKDLNKMIAILKKTINDLPIQFRSNEERDYGQVNISLSVRFPAEAIRVFLESSEAQMWAALGASAGLPNPKEWATLRGRVAFADRSPNNTDLAEAQKIQAFLKELKAEHNKVKEAEMLIKFLRADNKDKMLHRAMIDLVGRDQLLIRGSVKGVFSPKKSKSTTKLMQKKA